MMCVAAAVRAHTRSKLKTKINHKNENLCFGFSRTAHTHIRRAHTHTHNKCDTQEHIRSIRQNGSRKEKRA